VRDQNIDAEIEDEEKVKLNSENNVEETKTD